MRFQPTLDRVYVKRDPAKEATDGGLALPEQLLQ